MVVNQLLIVFFCNHIYQVLCVDSNKLTLPLVIANTKKTGNGLNKAFCYDEM